MTTTMLKVTGLNVTVSPDLDAVSNAVPSSQPRGKVMLGA